jgi:lysophospholipase L1-like esterase
VRSPLPLLSLLLGSTLALAAPASVRFLVPEAVGPPDISCSDSLAAARVLRGQQAVAKAELPPRPKPPPTAAVPAIVPVTHITLAGRALATDPLPGAHPQLLPLQPLQGDPTAASTIARLLGPDGSQRRVRISVFGASHTAGDWFTGHLRRLLQDRNGDLGHGFAWPAPVISGDRAQDLNLCRTDGWVADYSGARRTRGDGLLGVGGASLSTADPTQFSWFQTTTSNPHGQKATRFDVYSLGQPEGGGLLLTADAATPVRVSTRSETPAFLHHTLVVPDGGHRFTVAPAGDGEVRLFGVSMEREGPGVLVDAIGLSGRTARSWLDWDEDLHAAGLQALGPDIVVLAYGTNEANDPALTDEQYVADLERVLDRLHRGAPNAACLLVGPTDRFQGGKQGRYSVWPRTVRIAALQGEVAARKGCAFWDWQAAMGGEGAMVGWHNEAPPLASNDGIHLTREGYELSAERLLAAIDHAGGR